jgi:uncharacterized protein involved in copper resistance
MVEFMVGLLYRYECMLHAPNVGVSRPRGSGKTRSLTRTLASQTGQLNEREARVGWTRCWAGVWV